jgi:hypothetical protein
MSDIGRGTTGVSRTELDGCVLGGDSGVATKDERINRMHRPFSQAVVRCRYPAGCSAAQLLSTDELTIEAQLVRIGWSGHGPYGWICPLHDNRPVIVKEPREPLLTDRVLALIAAIRDGHDFGLAITRETGLSESTVYATLRRLRKAGWAVCDLEPAEIAILGQRPRRKIYQLTAPLLEKLEKLDRH